jgi:hypothetical protein
MGLGPAAVRARLADLPAGWPIPPAFRIATPQGELDFLGLPDLMMDPGLATLATVFRTGGDPLPPGDYVACREYVTRAGGTAEPAAPVLMFRDGRLEAVFQPIDTPGPPPPNVRDRKAMEAWIRRPRTSPFLVRDGALPLEDGLGFLDRWPKRTLAPDDRLSAACGPFPKPPSPPARHRHALDASDMQGLALLPFAVTLPGKNAQRTAARRRGPATLAALRLGEPLGATPEAFAAANPGVRAYPAAGGDYAVLSIDLGAYPGRNLTNFNDAALVGVRQGRVEWISPPASFGPAAALLCLDAHGVPAAPRPGCSGWGRFSP